MTSVSVSHGATNPTHDISLSDGTNTYGLIYAGGPRVLQEIPISPPAQPFANEQKNWVSGRGRIKYEDDPNGYFDDSYLWSTSEGRLTAGLQWRLSKSFGNQYNNLPKSTDGLYTWMKLYNYTSSLTTEKTVRYVSVFFTPSSNWTLDHILLPLRYHGSPSTLTIEVCSDNAGVPGTVLKTATFSTSNILSSYGTGTLANLFQLSVGQAITAATKYHIKVYGAATDNSTNYWELLFRSNTATSTSPIGYHSTNGTAWSLTNADNIGYDMSLCFAARDAEVAQQWRFFFHQNALYAVNQRDDGTTDQLITNGVRGKATSAASTSLTDTNLTMTVDDYAGAYIKIFQGKGDGQVRQIVSNTADTFTVAAWDITPDSTSQYFVYGTDIWTSTTGTNGLGSVTGKPVSFGTVCYFPQGQSTNIRRMRVNGSSHDFAADGTNKADLLFINTEAGAPRIYAANSVNATLQSAAVAAWGVNLTLGTALSIGVGDYRITNMISHNKILYVFKEDGIYTVQGNVVEKLGSAFSDVPDPQNGIGAGSKDGFLWWGWAHSVERMSGGSSIDDMLNWKSGYSGVPSDRTGVILSIVSAVGWLFFAIDGGASNYSSIMVWNGIGWHEIFRGWKKGLRIRNITWQPCPGTRGRLWFDIGGRVGVMEFPLYAANPAKDDNINYHWEGVIVTSTYDNHDSNLYKVISNLRVFVENNTVQIPIRVDYQANSDVGTSNWTVLGNATASPVNDFSVQLGGIFQIRFRFVISPYYTHNAISTAVPAIIGWQLTGRMMEPKKYQFVGTFRAQTDGETLTSESDHDPNTLYTQLQTWAVQQTKLTMRSTNYSNDNKIVTVSLPTKSVDWINETEWGGRISFAMLEV